MSTGLECCLVERKLGEWYYILEKWGAPKNAWSWLDYADAYGPFKSEELALDHLHNNHPNPGGYSIITFEHYAAFSPTQAEAYEDLMQHATKRGTNVFIW